MSSHRFPSEAERAFSFLEKMGFHLVEKAATRIQYVATRAFVAIEWDPRSGELNAFLGPHAASDEQPAKFSLTDLLRMRGVDVPEGKMPFQVADEGRIGPFLKRIAEDIRAYARPALAGDMAFFDRLEAFRSSQAHTEMRSMEVGRIRSAIDRAWRERNYRKVRELYSSVGGDLSDADRAKLAYAKKHDNS